MVYFKMFQVALKSQAVYSAADKKTLNFFIGWWYYCLWVFSEQCNFLCREAVTPCGIMVPYADASLYKIGT